MGGGTVLIRVSIVWGEDMHGQSKCVQMLKS